MTDDEKIVIEVLMALDGTCPDCGHPGISHKFQPARTPEEVTCLGGCDLCYCEGLSFWPMDERPASFHWPDDHTMTGEE